MSEFTDLVATAVANAQNRAALEASRDELARLLAALRRVATLIAAGSTRRSCPKAGWARPCGRWPAGPRSRSSRRRRGRAAAGVGRGSGVLPRLRVPQQRDQVRAARHIPYGVGHLLECRLVYVSGDDGGALSAQFQGVGAAQAARRASDDDDPAGERAAVAGDASALPPPGIGLPSAL
jgi:hypothetical protein